jgi:hypothetical protein
MKKTKPVRLTLKALESRVREMERERRDDAAMVDLVRCGRIAEIEERAEVTALILRLEARVSCLEAALRVARAKDGVLKVEPASKSVGWLNTYGPLVTSPRFPPEP